MSSWSNCVAMKVNDQERLSEAERSTVIRLDKSDCLSQLT